MVAIFFIYGLAFFVLGTSIYLCPRKDSEYKLASDLWLIAAFGISHGLNEWLDMLILISGPADGVTIKIIKVLILPVSFLFLVRFGTKVIASHIEKGEKSGLRLIPAVLFVAWMIMTELSHQRFLYGDIWARYLIGAPGIFMTSCALYLELAAFKKEEVPVRIISNLKLAAGSFICYGFFAGMIVPEAAFFPASHLNYAEFFNRTGIPVQIFRALCACVIAISLTRVLLVFDWETRNKFKIILDELRDSRDRLARSEKLTVVGTMTAGIVHELRNPLAAIKGAAYYIKHKIGDGGLPHGDATISKFLGVIEDEVNAGDKIINDLLIYLRVGKLLAVPSDVNDVIERAMHLIEIPDNVKVDMRLKDNLDHAMIDGDQIRQVFLNIILNALQSMPQGGMLKIETCRREMFIEAKFTDTGCGIEKENIGKIFEPLFTTKAKGAGLGLAVTKAIVDKHDGKIEMKSERDRGTTFVVKLPMA